VRIQNDTGSFLIVKDLFEPLQLQGFLELMVGIESTMDPPINPGKPLQLQGFYRVDVVRVLIPFDSFGDVGGNIRSRSAWACAALVVEYVYEFSVVSRLRCPAYTRTKSGSIPLLSIRLSRLVCCTFPDLQIFANSVKLIGYIHPRLNLEQSRPNTSLAGKHRTDLINYIETCIHQQYLTLKNPALEPFGKLGDIGCSDIKCHGGYFVYRLDTEGGLYADDGPLMEETDVALHLFTPITFDPTNLIRQVKRRLHKAGFSWPSSMSLSGGPGYARQVSMPEVKDHRHVVFLCNHISFISNGD